MSARRLRKGCKRLPVELDLGRDLVHAADWVRVGALRSADDPFELAFRASDPALCGEEDAVVQVFPTLDRRRTFHVTCPECRTRMTPEMIERIERLLRSEDN